MGMGQGVVTGVGQGVITCVLQTQFSSFGKRSMGRLIDQGHFMGLIQYTYSDYLQNDVYPCCCSFNFAETI